MHKYALALLVVTIPILPLSLRACDDDVSGIGIVHFKDGPAPIGPIPVCARLGDPSYYKCSAFFVFRDYGAARTPTPPAPMPVIQQRKNIGS